MKTLYNYVLLFDGECTIGSTYTKVFVKTGMLTVDGRASYQKVDEKICQILDQQRAAIEIALVDTITGEVTYGIECLFKIIGNSFPLLNPVLNLKPFIYLMSKFYSFISYNRNIIIPAETKLNTVKPSFKLRYRILYLLSTWLVTSFILTHYTHLLVDFVPLGSKLREYLICGGQIILQGIIVWHYKKDKLWSYLGNMMTISFTGALLLTPAIVAAKIFDINSILFILYFLLIAGLMFLEHLRRSKLLKLGWLMSMSWLIYRLAILGLILNF